MTFLESTAFSNGKAGCALFTATYVNNPAKRRQDVAGSVKPDITQRQADANCEVIPWDQPVIVA